MADSEAKKKFEKTNFYERTDFNGSHSIKTNFLVLFKYLRKVFDNLEVVADYLKEVAKNASSKGQSLEVIKELRVSKPVFLLDMSKTIGTPYAVSIGTEIFNITKTSDKGFEITNTDWNVDNLIVMAKDIDGNVLYPIIKTKSKIITIKFTEQQNKNINIFIL